MTEQFLADIANSLSYELIQQLLNMSSVNITLSSNSVRLSTFLFCTLFLTMGGCINDSTIQSSTNSAKLELKITKSVYALADSTAQIAFTIHNTSDSTAYFFHCNHRFVAIIQKYENHRWKFEKGRGSLCLAIYLSGTKPVYSDSVVSDSLTLSQEGKYRVLLPFSWQKNASRTDSLFSNEFILTIR